MIKFQKLKLIYFCDFLQVGFRAPDIKRGPMKSWIISRDIELRYEEIELCWKLIFYDICFRHFQTLSYQQTFMRMARNSASNGLEAWNTLLDYILKHWLSSRCFFDLCFVSYSDVSWLWWWGNPCHFKWRCWLNMAILSILICSVRLSSD